MHLANLLVAVLNNPVAALSSPVAAGITTRIIPPVASMQVAVKVG